MTRQSFPHQRPWNAVLPGIGIVALAAVLIHVAGSSAPPPSVAATVVPAVLEDTGTEILAIAEPQAPPARVAARASRPVAPRVVNWAALSGGAASVEVTADLAIPQPADLQTDLNADQAMSLIADVDGPRAGRASGRAGTVIGRGTPRGGGACD